MIGSPVRWHDSRQSEPFLRVDRFRHVEKRQLVYGDDPGCPVLFDLVVRHFVGTDTPPPEPAGRFFWNERHGFAPVEELVEVRVGVVTVGSDTEHELLSLAHRSQAAAFTKLDELTNRAAILILSTIHDYVVAHSNLKQSQQTNRQLSC